MCFDRLIDWLIVVNRERKSSDSYTCHAAQVVWTWLACQGLKSRWRQLIHSVFCIQLVVLDLMSCCAGCVDLAGVPGLEVQMTSTHPLSLLYSTSSSGSTFWKGVSVPHNLYTGSQQAFVTVKCFNDGKIEKHCCSLQLHTVCTSFWRG